jgi:hypothetical protein
MRHSLTLLKGLTLGAGMMYLLDPRAGRRRRALLNDQITHFVNKTDSMIQKGLCDLSNRVQGFVAECTAMLTSDDADDSVIAERVRSAMGHCVSNPRAIQVECQQGRVRLSGSVAADEVDHLFTTLLKVRGVNGLENRLELHDRTNAPHNGRAHGVLPTGWTPDAWTPAARLVAGAAGGLLLIRLIGRRPLGLAALGAVGAAVVAKSASKNPHARHQMPRRSQSMTSASL